MESSRSATQQAGSPRQRVWSSPPAAYNPTAASTHSSPLQTSPSMVVGGTESNVIGLVKEELLAEVTKVREWAKDEVAKERRINLRLRQQLQQDFELKQHLQQRLEQVQAECRAEQRERMSFVLFEGPRGGDTPWTRARGSSVAPSARPREDGTREDGARALLPAHPVVCDTVQVKVLLSGALLV